MKFPNVLFLLGKKTGLDKRMECWEFCISGVVGSHSDSNGYCVITVVSFPPFAAQRPELQCFRRIWEYVLFA